MNITLQYNDEKVEKQRIKREKKLEKRLSNKIQFIKLFTYCLLYTSPSPRDKRQSRMPSSA